jgi:hypothetical protein
VPNEIGAWIHETIGHTQELHMDSHERELTRRELRRLGVAASVAAVWSPPLLRGWAAPPFVATPSTVAGPFYPMLRPRERDQDLTRHAGHKAREPTGAVGPRAAPRVRERQE